MGYRYRAKKKKKQIFEVIYFFIILLILTKITILDKIAMIQIRDWILIITSLCFLLATPLIYKKYKKNKKYKEYLNNPIHLIDIQDGSVFEEQLAAYFTNEGYKVEIVGKSHDYGADLVITKNNIKYVVQAKRYKANVGIQAIQQVLGAKEYYKANRAMVCTNSHFTKSAINLANSSNVILWDRKDLMEKMKK